MHSVSINRHEWLKAVTQDAALPDRVTKVAVALWSFANDETGQLNPSVTSLAGFVKRSTDTVKRAIADLVKAGWLHRTEGRGRGNSTAYALRSPGKVIAISSVEKGANKPRKKGGSTAPLSREKGAALRGKGGNTAPFHYKDKQPLEQRAGATPGRPAPAAQYHVSRGSPAETDWNRWLQAHGFPSLIELDQRLGDGWNLPATLPPTDLSGIDGRIAEKWATWRVEGRCYA